MTMHEPAEILRQISAVLPHAVIAVDFDGTVTPISPHPADSVPDPNVIDALIRLARAGAKVAVITGRSAMSALDVGGLAAVPGIVIEGVYGAERWQDGELHTQASPEAMSAVRAELTGLVDRLISDPHVWIEDKRLSLVIHARLTADSDATLATLREPVTSLAHAYDLEVRPGAEVLEICIPRIDKGGAVWRLVNDATDGLLYIGDDVGDVPAFVAVREWRDKTARPALTVGVVSGTDSPIAGLADIEVGHPAAVGELLEDLLSQLDPADPVT